MFKAKLIEEQNYYTLRNDQIFLNLLPAMPMAIILNYYSVSILTTIACIAAYIIAIIAIRKNHKLMQALIGERRIEINEKQISIQTQKGKTKEIIPIDEINEITVLEEYVIPGDTMKEHGREFLGNIEKNFIVIKKGQEEQRFDFELDSHYMIVQLNKIIEAWKANGPQVRILERRPSQAK